MALLEPVGGLRPVRLRYDSKRPYKGKVIVPAGAELTVPAGVAEQLQADTHFKVILGEDGPETVVPLADLTPPAKRKPRKKEQP